MTPNSLSKQTLLRAPLSTVWLAIADSEQFGSWFGVRFDAPFVPGAKLTGVITPTEVDSGVAETQDPYAGLPFEIWVEAVEEPTRFAFRWHPFAVEPDQDYSEEPTTLVEFLLEEQADGVLLTVIETGFNSLPENRRFAAFEANDQGWTDQMELVAKYLKNQSE